MGFDAVGFPIGRGFAGRNAKSRAVSTSVEIVRLATDPRLVLELAAVAVVPE